MRTKKTHVMVIALAVAIAASGTVQAARTSLPFIEQDNLFAHQPSRKPPPTVSERDRLQAIHRSYETQDKQTYTTLVNQALTESFSLTPTECLARQRELLSVGQELGFDGLEPLTLAYHDCAASSDNSEEVRALASIMTNLQEVLHFDTSPMLQTQQARGALHVLITNLGPLWAAEAEEVPANAQQLSLRTDVYNALQNIEDLIPIPQEAEIVDMGTFNVSTGEFSGKTSQQEVMYVNGKPRVVMIRPSETIDAVNVQLRFNFQFRGLGPLRVITNDVRTEVPTLHDSVTIDLGRTGQIAWRIETDLFSIADEIVIARSELVSGAGAFTVEALPISILYEPPQYGGLLSRTTFETTKSIGSSMSVAESTATSESQTKFGTISALADGLNGIASVFAFFQQKKPAEGLKFAASLVTKLAGESTTTNTEGTEVTSEHTVDLLTTESILSETSAGLGPGRGDRIFYLKDIQIAWMMDRGEVSFTILGWRGEGRFTVETLKADLEALEDSSYSLGPLTGLSGDSLQALLALDPLALGELGPFVLGSPSLPSPRFECKGTDLRGDGGVDTFTVSHTIRTTDRTREAHFTSTVTDFKSGWIDRLFNGTAPGGSKKMTTTHTSTRQVQISETVSASIKINSPIGDSYRLNAYYDTVFGTFAAKEINPFETPGANDACGSGPLEVFGDFGNSGTNQGNPGGTLAPSGSIPTFSATLAR